MMPGALTSTRRRSVGLDRALAVDRVAERVDDAAEQALADRHVDDGAGALHRLAFRDLAVGAEDHDADIVGLEVERHAAHAGLELDHLAGLDLVEAVEAGDAVADGQNLADLGDLGLGAEVLDLLLQDRGDFGGADVHSAGLFHGKTNGIEFGAHRGVDHAGAHLDDEAADEARVDLDVDGDVGLGDVAQRRRISSMTASEGCSASVTWARTMPLASATSSRKARIMSGSANRRRLEATRRMKLPARPPTPVRDQDGADRRRLLLGREDGVADQALQVGAVLDERVEAVEVGRDRVDGARLLRELEQGRSVACRHAGQERSFLRTALSHERLSRVSRALGQRRRTAAAEPVRSGMGHSRGTASARPEGGGALAWVFGGARRAARRASREAATAFSGSPQTFLDGRSGTTSRGRRARHSSRLTISQLRSTRPVR